MSDTAANTEERLVLRFIREMLGQRRLDIAAEVFSEDVLDHQAGGSVQGVDGLVKGIRRFLSAFPDLTISLNALTVETPVAIAWVTWQGTHQECFMGLPATGCEVTVGCVFVFRAEDGRLAERWELIDAPTLLRQLNVPKVLPKARAPWSLFGPGARPLLRIRW